MKKWIRWQGLVPFLIILALVLAFWFLLLDPMVKWAVERTGTEIVGARVDLDAADVTLSPLGVTLSRLQVTDPRQPLRNSIEVKRIAFSLDGLNLLRRKVIINEMTAEGIRFGTKRKSSGAVMKAQKPPKPRQKDSFEIPSFEIPDVKTALQQEDLGTVKLVSSLQADLKDAESKWKKQAAAVPDKAKMNEYRKRIDELKKAKKRGATALLQSAEKAGALATEIRKDLNQVKDLQNSVNTELASWKKRIYQVEQAPLEDAKRISAKYGFSTEGLKNMSAMLFGRKISDWVSTGLLWYGRLQPVVERAVQEKGKAAVVKPVRGRGENVRFKENHPLPGFLIATIKASAQPAAGSFDGTIRNVTPDQDILGKPLTFSFSGTVLPDIGSVTLTGTLNHVYPARSDDQATVSIRQYTLRDVALTESDALAVSLKRAVADCTIESHYRDGRISASMVATLRSAELSTAGTRADKPVIASLAKALSGVKGFTLNAMIDGTPEQYDIRISSDLDRVLQQAVGSFVKDQGARFEQKLRAAIAEQTEGRVKELKGSLSILNGLSADLNSSSSSLNGLLNEALSAGKTGGIKLPF
jgi:uncharacterized protein (TIGR03545 family)